MTEHIVKHVGFLEIIELVGLADEIARRETPLAQMPEKHIVGHHARHRHDGPVAALVEPVVELLEVGHAGMAQAEHIEPFFERSGRLAVKQVALAGE